MDYIIVNRAFAVFTGESVTVEVNLAKRVSGMLKQIMDTGIVLMADNSRQYIELSDITCIDGAQCNKNSVKVHLGDA